MRIRVSDVVLRLRQAHVELAPGLTSSQLRVAEERLEIEFNEVHRSLLNEVLPVGRGWVDWRDAGDPALRDRVEAPIEGVVFDVHHSGFWPAPWGERPAARQDAEQVARQKLAEVPRLVPLYSHRHFPPNGFPPDSPVFSVVRTDVIFYGDNLLDYVARQFSAEPPASVPVDELPWIPFWSALATGDEDLVSRSRERSG